MRAPHTAAEKLSAMARNGADDTFKRVGSLHKDFTFSSHSYHNDRPKPAARRDEGEKPLHARVAGFAQIQRMCEWGQREIGSHYAF